MPEALVNVSALIVPDGERSSVDDTIPRTERVFVEVLNESLSLEVAVEVPLFTHPARMSIENAKRPKARNLFTDDRPNTVYRTQWETVVYKH